MPRMNDITKITFALEHIAHLHDLIKGNKFEGFLKRPLREMEFELDRQLHELDSTRGKNAKRKSKSKHN